MKVAVIGAGFTGLSAAYRLALAGHEVTIYEKEKFPGGLAGGFKEAGWEWPLEKHYHHLFATDSDILELCKRIDYPINFYSPKTSTLFKSSIYQLDNPLSLLKFPHLSFPERIRTGAVLAFLKVTPFWKPLEYLTSRKFLNAAMGKKSWEVLWKPLFEKKFHNYSAKISATWFWARIHFRTQKLGYPEGGFDGLSNFLAQKLIGMGVNINYSTEIKLISMTKQEYVISVNKNHQNYDGVIFTLPVPALLSLTDFLSADFKNSLKPIDSLGAVNLVLALKRRFMVDGSYWLNVNDMDIPFLAVVEHTNFIDKSHYAGDSLVYVGNYLPQSHPYYPMSEKQLLSEYLAGLKKINPEFNLSWVRKSWVWKAPYAQSVITTRFSEKVPPKRTPYPNFILANIQQVYPWDRGTNYAVKIGRQAAEYVTQKNITGS